LVLIFLFFIIFLRGAFFWHPMSRGWCLPFPGTDLELMERTQRYMHEVEKKRPAQTAYYISFASLLQAISVLFIMATVALFSKFQCGRGLLLKVRSFARNLQDEKKNYSKTCRSQFLIAITSTCYSILVSFREVS